MTTAATLYRTSERRLSCALTSYQRFARMHQGGKQRPCHDMPNIVARPSGAQESRRGEEMGDTRGRAAIHMPDDISVRDFDFSACVGSDAQYVIHPSRS